MAMATMSNEETFRFIELYQAENCLWNPKNKDHKNKNIVNDAWKRIADTMGVPIHELKKKKDDEDDAYKPIWLFYDAMEVFLKDIYECNSICNSEQNDHQREENTGVIDLDSEEGSSGQTSDIGNITSENNNPLIKSQVGQKRRSKNPPELQEAGKHMSAAFNTLNKVLQSKKTKEDKDEDDSDLFCKLLAKQLKDFPKEEREEIMYEIHRLIINKRRHYHERVLQHSPSPTTIYNRSSISAQSSPRSYESLPKRNITSPHSPSPTLYSHTSPSQIIVSHPSSSHSSHITQTLPQNFKQDTTYQAPPVDQQPILYSHASPSHILISRPSSSRNSYSTTSLSQNLNQEKSYDNQYISNNVQILSQETLQPGTINNILLEAYEKATGENI